MQPGTPGTETPTTTPSPTPGTGAPTATPGAVADAVTGIVPEWLLVPGWQYVAAAIILVVGYFVSRYVTRLVGRPVARRFRRQSVAQMALRSIRLSILFVSSVAAANVLGLEFGNIVLSVTVFSAVLGIVLAPIVGSVISGLFVLADQPYEIGDMVELEDGRRGFVEEITIRYTKLFTLDNTFLVIPNSGIRDRLVTNYSAEDERIRLSLDVLITYESDLDRARRVMQRAAANCDDVIEGGPDIRIGSARYPARPTTLIESFGDHGVVLRLRYWARKPYKIPSVRSQVQQRIWDSVNEDGVDVEFAYPHQHLVFDDTSGTLRAELGNAPEAPRSDAGGGLGTSSRRRDGE
jgi:small-conductance mechanosensitive channel